MLIGGASIISARHRCTALLCVGTWIACRHLYKQVPIFFITGRLDRVRYICSIFSPFCSVLFCAVFVSPHYLKAYSTVLRLVCYCLFVLASPMFIYVFFLRCCRVLFHKLQLRAKYSRQKSIFEHHCEASVHFLVLVFVVILLCLDFVWLLVFHGSLYWNLR